MSRSARGRHAHAEAFDKYHLTTPHGPMMRGHGALMLPGAGIGDDLMKIGKSGAHNLMKILIKTAGKKVRGAVDSGKLPRGIVEHGDLLAKQLGSSKKSYSKLFKHFLGKGQAQNKEGGFLGVLSGLLSAAVAPMIISAISGKGYASDKYLKKLKGEDRTKAFDMIDSSMEEAGLGMGGMLEGLDNIDFSAFEGLTTYPGFGKKVAKKQAKGYGGFWGALLSLAKRAAPHIIPLIAPLVSKGVEFGVKKLGEHLTKKLSGSGYGEQGDQKSLEKHLEKFAVGYNEPAIWRGNVQPVGGIRSQGPIKLNFDSAYVDHPRGMLMDFKDIQKTKEDPGGYSKFVTLGKRYKTAGDIPAIYSYLQKSIQGPNI